MFKKNKDLFKFIGIIAIILLLLVGLYTIYGGILANILYNAVFYGKYNTTPYDKLQMDLMYISNPSLIEDWKILFATVKILFESESTEGIAEGATTA